MQGCVTVGSFWLLEVLGCSCLSLSLSLLSPLCSTAVSPAHSDNITSCDRGDQSRASHQAKAVKQKGRLHVFFEFCNRFFVFVVVIFRLFVRVFFVRFCLASWIVDCLLLCMFSTLQIQTLAHCTGLLLYSCGFLTCLCVCIYVLWF